MACPDPPSHPSRISENPGTKSKAPQNPKAETPPQLSWRAPTRYPTHLATARTPGLRAKPHRVPKAETHILKPHPRTTVMAGADPPSHPSRHSENPGTKSKAPQKSPKPKFHPNCHGGPRPAIPPISPQREPRN